MKNNKDIDENVEPSFLDDLKKSGDFKTPVDFFDDFQKDVQNKIHSDSPSWIYLPQVKFGVSSLAILAIAALVFYPSTPQGVADYSITETEYVAYLDENIDEISEEEIIEELNVAELTEVGNEIESEIYLVEGNQQVVTVDSTAENSKEKSTVSMEELTEDEILEYLIEEGYEDGDWDEL